jgi:putative DNA primase/helicase
MDTATEITEGHYQRPEVKEVILKLCSYAGGLRGLNGDEGWYSKGPGGSVKLRGPGDYDDTTARARSLYMTADVFDPKVFDLSAQWIEGRGGEGRPAFPLGTRGDLISYSLFADIDATKEPGETGSKLYHPGRIEALEAAASFMVRYLKDRGISESVGVLFSGQGIYVWLHPSLSDVSENRALAGFDREKQDHDFKVWLEAFNALLYDIEKAFFEEYPEHVGRAKFDKLNNQKRKIKCLLSIHKTMPFAVVPLDRDDVKIDLERARLTLDGGLPSETIAEAEAWLDGWKTGEGERKALISLLKPYAAKAERDISRKANTSGEISRASEPIPILDWCPFYQALGKFPGGTGAHRVCGALAAWLYQAGWEEGDAFDLWYNVAARCDVETRIFYTSYGVINSPSCRTIQKTSAGYPSLGFGGLNLCNPNEKCEGATWPGQYGAPKKDEPEDVCVRDVCNITVVNEGKDSEREDLVYSPSKAADVMINHFDLISTPDGLIWIYEGGIYRPDGEHVIGSFLDRIVGDMMPIRLLKETLAKIVYRTREDYEVFNPDPCIFGVQNGVIDMRTGKFAPHSPSWKITRKAPVVYDPSAECPEIQRFLSSSLSPDDLRSLLEIFAAKTTRIVFEYFAAFVGRGQNGKTICEELIRAFWGDDATTEVQLSGLGKNRFDLVELKDKYWLINSEVGGGQQESRWIKLISGGGKVTADQKGRDHVEFRASCFIIFDCNNPPKFQDNSHGFNRRLILLTWPYSFVDSPTPGVEHERKRDPDLLSKITSPSELSGLLNVLIRIAPKVIESRMIYRRATGAQLAEEYDLKSSSAEVFWDRFCEPDDNTDTPSLWLYQKYEEFCKLVGATAKRDRDFNDIGRKIHKVKKGRTDTPQGRVQSWKFISFSDEEYNKFLCSWSFRPASDQQETSKKQQQDQQDQQDQHKDVYGLEKENKDIFYMGSKTTRSCWSAGPDSDSAGHPAGHAGQLVRNDDVLQVLSEMERQGDAYNVSAFELEWDLDEGEGAPLLEARGWEERSPGIWYPPTRM